MDTDLGQLVAAFQAYFLSLYKQAQPASDTQAPASTAPFLAFEAIGVPMSEEMFALKTGEFDAGLAMQQFSLCANAAPALDGQILRGGGLLTLDALYDLLLTEATPASVADLDGFGHLKHAAQEAFSNAESSYSIPGVQGVFHPASPTPADFPAPSGAACWTRHSFEQNATIQASIVAGPPKPALPAPGPVHMPMPNWGWRMATPEMAGLLHRTPVQIMAAMPHIAPPAPPAAPPRVVPPPPPRVVGPARPAAPILAFHPTMLPGMLPGLHPAARPNPPSPPLASLLGRPVALPAHLSVAPGVPVPGMHPIFRADLMRTQMQQMNASATAQATTTKRFTLSFDYCLVTAARPWLSGELLIADDWFVPHMPAGQIATGTGIGTGVFEALPVAALMVRNLVIEGDWSDADRAAMQGSLNFGPFSLMGRSIETVTSTLSSPGMQLVAWVLEPLPCLPPIADPGLASGAASPPASPATAQAAPMPAPTLPPTPTPLTPPPLTPPPPVSTPASAPVPVSIQAAPGMPARVTPDMPSPVPVTAAAMPVLAAV